MVARRLAKDSIFFPLTAYCLLPTAYSSCLLLTAHCSLLTAYCLLFLFTAHCSLLTAYSSLSLSPPSGSPRRQRGWSRLCGPVS
ncbi:MAG: hypothetical protein C4576_28035 [Desulfobacteraceae bacterium]|nr:MAG: hypothetical protein C4576_28035 [Desulfobacteraceae bacterium]